MNKPTDIEVKVTTHASREGRADYLGRAEDVARGAEEPEWAWPFAGADAAYINAMTIDAILAEIGLDDVLWEEISDEWCAAFKRGYEAAHNEAPQDIQVTGDATGIRITRSTPPTRIGTMIVSGRGNVGIDLDDDEGE